MSFETMSHQMNKAVNYDDAPIWSGTDLETAQRKCDVIVKVQRVTVREL
jgi:hypothetical protein